MLAVVAMLAGCGTTKSRTATEQLLVSDTVDRAIAVIDFAPLAGRTVYLDNKYLVPVKGIGFVNTEYVTSSLRQQMIACGCLLQDELKDADYVVEARIGALGTDSHEVTYGIPPSSGLAHAAELMPTGPRIPIPDISLAKREDLLGATKVAVFAYHRDTRIPVWQSGMSVATSNARDSYILGVGPIQDGTIYHGAHFAGSRWQLPLLSGKTSPPPTRGLVSYYDEVRFDKVAGRPRIPGQRTPEQLNAEIQAIVKVPKLSPLTESMFAAIEAARGPTSAPVGTVDPAAPPAAALELAAPAVVAPQIAAPQAAAPQVADGANPAIGAAGPVAAPADQSRAPADSATTGPAASLAERPTRLPAPTIDPRSGEAPAAHDSASP